MTYKSLKEFPPYGFLPEHFAVMINNTPVQDFRPTDPNRHQRWDEFFESTLTLFNRTLWPRFDPATGGWDHSNGAVDNDAMNALTEADFRVFAKLSNESPSRGLGHFPKVDRSEFGCKTQMDLFVQEDGRLKDIDKTDFGDGLAPYDRNYGRDIAAAARTVMDNAMLKKDLDGKASVGIPFKAKLQRPRPYQIALMVGMTKFRNERANTAPSPSMINGHCAQGIVGTCGVLERLLRNNRSFPAPALRQFMVDVGDRRVMAGVHYPSDSVSSWMLCLLSAEHLFASHVQDLRREMWTAISKHSHIFALIKNDIEEQHQLGKKSGFFVAFEELHKIASSIV